MVRKGFTLIELLVVIATMVRPRPPTSLFGTGKPCQTGRLGHHKERLSDPSRCCQNANCLVYVPK